MRWRNATYHRYYYRHNHDPLRARGEHRRCPERNIRADALDALVFEQLRSVLERPIFCSRRSARSLPAHRRPMMNCYWPS
jgi:hypothetical protein